MGLVNVFMGIRKDSHYMCVCVKVKKGIFMVFINLKTNEKPMVNN